MEKYLLPKGISISVYDSGAKWIGKLTTTKDSVFTDEEAYVGVTDFYIRRNKAIPWAANNKSTLEGWAIFKLPHDIIIDDGTQHFEVSFILVHYKHLIKVT